MVAEATRSERRSQRNMANNANKPNGNGDATGVGVTEQPPLVQDPPLVQASSIGSTSITATSSVGGGGRVRPREESVATPETSAKQPRAKFDSPLQGDPRREGQACSLVEPWRCASALRRILGSDRYPSVRFPPVPESGSPPPPEQRRPGRQ